jgi:hypothetical protein
METEDGRIAIFASRASEDPPWSAAGVVFPVLDEAMPPLADFDISAE